MLAKNELLLCGGALAILALSVALLRKQQTPVPPPIPQSLLLTNSHLVSNMGSGTTIVYKVSDYECPACKKAQHAIRDDFDAVPNVSWRIVPYPLDFHKLAYKMAILGEVAAERGAFGEFHQQMESLDLTDPDAVEFVLAYWHVSLGTLPFDYEQAYERAETRIEKIKEGVPVTAIPAFYVYGRGEPFATHSVDELMRYLGAKRKSVHVASGTCGPDCD
jgi:hypothetical protein